MQGLLRADDDRIQYKCYHRISFFDGVSEVDGSLVGIFIIRFRGQSDEGDGLALLQIRF